MRQRKALYTAEDVKVELFYRLPKFLFDEELKDLSNDARVLFSLLKDQHNENIQKGWVNDQGEIYHVYDKKEIAQMLYCSVSKVRKTLEELEKFDLIDIDLEANRFFLKY